MRAWLFESMACMCLIAAGALTWRAASYYDYAWAVVAGVCGALAMDINLKLRVNNAIK